MKHLLISLVLLGFSIGQAATLCPAQTMEKAACTAKDFIPLFPFASICQDTTGNFVMMLDLGNFSKPEKYVVNAAETETALSFTATEEGTDQLQLSIQKQTGTTKIPAVLSYFLGSSPVQHKFTCRMQ